MLPNLLAVSAMLTMIYLGPIATGTAPFLSETNPTPFGSSQNSDDGKNIFQLMGNISPYFPNPDGWGVQEWPLPANAKISQVHVLHREYFQNSSLRIGV